ncbi:uncharacterized protein LOC128547111 [Mercenaria mercenaria]|uniref:uncharacterized protein LOC128547111 n=1 Tax=Mercenaria mercenaria TaxID=6596 RepID=UPI00234EA257|nr:uncharacterized protein LOC128547111 [Mercenaria mercenaria]
MEVKIVLSLVFCACVWLVNGCNRNSSDCHGGTILQCRSNHRRSSRSLDDFAKRTEGNAEKKGHRYSIKLQDDPCNFNTYDIDQDGAIAKDELLAILSINEANDTLFALVDLMAEGRVIKRDEFYALVPMLIAECYDSDKE